MLDLEAKKRYNNNGSLCRTAEFSLLSGRLQWLPVWSNFMARFWCKVCGGTLEYHDESETAVCSVCGASGVLPVQQDEGYAEQYAELVRLRQSGDYQQAEELLYTLLELNGADPVLYWNSVLITYKAAYYSDDDSYGLLCGEAGDVSVQENEDFQKALHFASPAQWDIFENDGRLLEEARLLLLAESEKQNENNESPLNKGFLLLEDGAWDAADAQFDLVLADEPENGLVYFGKMMAELQVHRESELSRAGARLVESENYKQVQQYGNDMLLERVEEYRVTGVLFQATERGKLADTVDDWKHIKKMLMDIRENEQARDYLSLCDKKIRAIMAREAQLVMGCREAVNLGITTETLGTRMVSANYYYDFDMSTAEPEKKKLRKTVVSPSRIMATIALLVVLILVGVFALSSWMTKDTPSDIVYSQADATADNNNKAGRLIVTGGADYEEQFCAAGGRAFMIDSFGRVVNLSDEPAAVITEETQGGASFSGNVTPYESDFSTWHNVAALYSDPEGAVLFGVLNSGTVCYDIFSSSTMNYEDRYGAVSSWTGVKELVWEKRVSGVPVLFAVTRDSYVYASDAAVQKKLEALETLVSDDNPISQLQAQEGSLYILLEDGSYISFSYAE